MTDVAVEAVEPAVPPPPPPPVIGVNVQLPQAPARSAGPQRPQGSGAVSPEPARAQGNGSGGVKWRLIVLIVCIPLALMVGCGALMTVASGGGPKTSTSTTLPGGADELAEVSPGVWYPEYSDTARELIGPGRDAKLVMARKVKDIVDTRDAQGHQIANPCELWMNKDVYITVTFQRRWTVDSPVPVFNCPRGADGAYTPPVAPTPTTAPAGPGGAAAQPAVAGVAPTTARPAGE